MNDISWYISCYINLNCIVIQYCLIKYYNNSITINYNYHEYDTISHCIYHDVFSSYMIESFILNVIILTCYIISFNLIIMACLMSNFIISFSCAFKKYIISIYMIQIKKIFNFQCLINLYDFYFLISNKLEVCKLWLWHKMMKLTLAWLKWAG